ncbi:PDDEXK-like family protein [Noviherbaspirillum pedocola]|uniref:PD-(D/E)XK nuclease family protein n=1 Tax=Noviherbaspirillum pedocola TaxID=2801341 RepID=A0A934STI4_9BURK|nr:PD-(D/E)XK nuclease family protein [Noviherbaspirillum pedocola]MBK4735229.1 PD-(D/E)XK nuclease family protein [Noviherbaspirillum pedocola]
MELETELLSLLESLEHFEHTSSLSSQFNIFEAVNMARQEIRHSRFLAYLLDPSQPHGLDDRFLKAVIFAAAENHTLLPIPKLQLAIADYSEARVYCERDHFDISVEIPDLKLLFVIENKIGAGEREGQLIDYRKNAQKLYPEYKFFGCFLTADGYVGEDMEWASLSYSAITSSLRKLEQTGMLSPAVQMAIDHYVKLIEKRVMASKELIEACKRIYRQHRTALDLIYEHGSESLLGQAYIEFQEKHPSLGSALELRKEFLSFVPKSWANMENFDVADLSKWKTSCPIKFWLTTDAEHLHLKLEVGPVDGKKNFSRESFVAKLRKAFKSRENRRTGDVFTRILSRKVKLDEDAGVEHFAASLEKLWQQIDGDDVIQKVETAAKECLQCPASQDR